MTVLSPVLMPVIGYGGGVYINSSTDNATGVYRIEQWQMTNAVTNAVTNTATSTYPGWDNGTVSTAQAIQFRTLDTSYTQYTQGPNYTVRYYNGAAGGVDTTGCWAGYVYPPKTAAEKLREILNSRMAPGVLTNCRPLGLTNDVREVRARETLRRVLGENRFRDFVRRGSVSVRAKSGLVYQTFPGSDFTKVYDNGKLIERLCVVLLGGFPPTDSLIMRYLMILNNEQQFRSYAIKHGIQTPYLPAAPDQRSLIEIFKELKKVA